MQVPYYPYAPSANVASGSRVPFEPGELFPASHFTPENSAFVADFVVPGLFGVVLAAALLFWWRNRLLSRAQATPPSGRVVLEGTVETDASNPYAVRIELDQTGTEVSNKGVWSHSWREFNRRVFTAPFVLLTTDGRRVRVEPDPQVLLVTELTETKRLEHALRTRAASLRNGDRVIVVGAATDTSAGAGYRANPEALHVRAPSGERLVLSTEPLQARFERRANFHRRWAIALSASFVAVQLLFGLGFHLRRTTGEVVEGTISRLHSYTTTSKGHTYYHYVVTANATLNDTTETLDDEIPFSQYTQMRVGQRVPFLVPFGGGVPGALTMASVGEEPTMHVAGGIFALLTAIALLISWPIHTFTSLPWFARKRWHEGGTGRLEDSKP